MTNAIEWVLYGSAVVYIAPFVGNKTVSWQWEAGAIAVFLAWFNCLLYLQRYTILYSRQFREKY